MMKTNLKGVLLVLTGALSYGILATIVKYSNGLGLHTGALVFMQYLVGALALTLLVAIKQKQGDLVKVPTKSAKLKLVAYGTSIGLTSCLYYVAIQYVPVSLAIVLLMQSIWMGVVFEYIMYKKPIGQGKIIAALITIAGTILASDVLFQEGQVSFTGILWGLAAAACYTFSLFASSHIEKDVSSYIRSKYLIIGGLLAVILFWNTTLIGSFNGYGILLSGVILALFGTVLPPLLFTKGIPYIGLGLASILISVELPVSIMSAQFFLGESMTYIQWIGVFTILFSVVIANLDMIKVKN